MRDIIIDALIHAIKEILVFIFVTPFNLWVKACTKLAEQKRNKSLNLQGINSQWPFLTFLKRFNFDFYFDACIVLLYPIGILVAVSLFIRGIAVGYAGQGFVAMISTLIVFYYCPFYIALFRDICQVLLIPFRKYLSWGSKPAQYMDLNINK